MIRKAQVVWRGSACVGAAIPVKSGGERSESRRNAGRRACRLLHRGWHFHCKWRVHADRTEHRGGYHRGARGTGFRISCSALKLRAKVPNLTRATFETMAWHAVNNCPVSKVLRTQIRLDAKLL